MFNQGQQQPQLQNVPGGVLNKQPLGQPPNQPQQQNGFGKYTPSDGGITNLLTASPSDVGFDFDAASGEFQLVDNRQQKPAVPPSQPNQDNQQVNPQPTGTPNGNQTDPYQERFATIDTQFQSIGQALQRMAAYMEGLGRPQGQQQQTQDQPVQLDFQSDDFATNLLSVINSAMDKRFAAFEQKLTPIQNSNAQLNDRMVLNDLALEHGQKLLAIMPALQELKKSDPNLDLRATANALLKLPIASTDSTIRTDNGNSQQAQAVQPQSDQNQQLQHRANQLSTESGGIPRGVLNDEPPIKGVEDAFNKSLRDLGYS